ncbi:site-specific DNA-methyltransferase [Hymenobacter sp. B81]|uniref:site-specific DNA-methyltransferase n=1 Tax=Hymenobacter sp. B81 TaxID=3344878 RepID=UPI0037DDA628
MATLVSASATTSDSYKKLRQSLQDMFMLDKAELDFGIYRVMNQRRADIQQFLDHDLLPQVRQALTEHLGTDTQALQQELDRTIEQVLQLGFEPDATPKVQELRARLGQASDVVALENEVFSLLTTFFRRYYNQGDFVSQRRYKRDVYAIPYEGEEVKLHWANHDQYYIKTAEHLKHYQFRLGTRTVVFELVEAQLEQGNNKTQGERVRRFVLHEAEPVLTEGNTLRLRFRYELVEKGVSQEALLQAAVDGLKPLIPADFAALLAPAGADVKAPTLLEKYLRDYTARNTFDYFIHKDLRGFLLRELDFFLKSEVLLLDDLLAGQQPTGQELQQRMGRARAVRRIGEQIIGFLAQLEEFQKRLWLKKKMVVETHYCFTLDRVPEALYSTIASNKRQLAEWKRLFAVDDIKADSVTVGFQEEALPLEFLKQNPYLLVDTAFFDEDFKLDLLGSIENLDEELDGLLISSENFQALNLLQARYKEHIDCIYIDPPYNTDAGPIMYKNGYKSSSWTALMDNRLQMARPLLTEKGVLAAAIDDAQQRELSFLLSMNFDGNQLGTFCVRSNPSGRPTEAGYAVSHEYVIFAGNTPRSSISRMPPTPAQMARFKIRDDKGLFEWRNLRRDGSDSDRDSRRTMYYPIYISEATIRVPKMDWDDKSESWIVKENPKDYEQVIYPINDDGIEKRWRWEWETVMSSLDKLVVRKDGTGKDYIYSKRRPNEAGVVSVSSWFDAKYSSVEHGTKMLKHIFGYSPFTYPKSLYAVMDAIYIGGGAKSNTTILDFFAGSGTTANGVINLNRIDEGRRKYILVEMGEYFDTVTKPRVLKAAYSAEWKNGKPVNRKGISHAFKYIRLEGYEDTLNNLELKRTNAQQLALETHKPLRHEYLLSYLLDTESRSSLLNLDWFENPFGCQLNITRQYEQQLVTVDLVETFNYLLGLVVEHTYRQDGFRVVKGRTQADGQRVLVVWRDVRQHDHVALREFLKTCRYSPLAHQFDRIYVNGDHTVPNLLADEDGQWRVTLIEEEFAHRMFATSV